MRSLRPLLTSLAFCSLLGSLLVSGCKDESSNTVGASDASTLSDGGGGAKVGGPVMGEVDNHCMGKKQETSEAACHADAGAKPRRADRCRGGGR